MGEGEKDHTGAIPDNLKKAHTTVVVDRFSRQIKLGRFITSNYLTAYT